MSHFFTLPWQCAKLNPLSFQFTCYLIINVIDCLFTASIILGIASFRMLSCIFLAFVLASLSFSCWSVGGFLYFFIGSMCFEYLSLVCKLNFQHLWSVLDTEVCSFYCNVICQSLVLWKEILSKEMLCNLKLNNRAIGYYSRFQK